LIDPLPRFGDRRRTRVGLLGGSFNPAHAGHRHVAKLARKRLRLDQIWLLVSPGNPLKPHAGMAPLVQRILSARRIGDGRRILATGIEATFGTRFTVDTLRLLLRRFPRVEFVWLMGADILIQMPRWQCWVKMLHRIPFVVLPRPGYTRPALAGPAAHRMRHARSPERAAVTLPGNAPGWTLLTAPLSAVSATAIRRGAVP
jgi:nicotinate-nucleotide adenylyltransferase